MHSVKDYSLLNKKKEKEGLMQRVRDISLLNRKKKRDDRILSVIGYIKLNSDQTVYSLQKYFGWPIGSLHSMLKELKEDMHLKTETIIENNRKKKLYSLRMEEDFIVDYFNSRTLLVPINLRSAKNSQNKGFRIKVEMDNGSIVEIPPSYSIDNFIQDNNIKLDLAE